ncbi:MAG TPA: hypothetical protein VJR27_01625 [Candidatus Saccharimonadales bacterium]|nr:hypothetical protein [Candidatus Saccharimonadales bacterium]
MSTTTGERVTFPLGQTFVNEQIEELEQQFNPELAAEQVDRQFAENLAVIEETTSPEAKQEAATITATKHNESGDLMHRNHRWG